MPVFITGGTGYIGASVVRELRKRTHVVRALARNDAAAEKLRALGAEPVRGELRDLDVLRIEAANADAVIHCAFEYSAEAVALERDRFGGVFEGAVDHRVGVRGFDAQHVEVAQLAADRLGAEPVRGVIAGERAHDVRALAQLADDARPDVSRTARDKNRHQGVSLPGADGGRATMVTISRTSAASAAAMQAPIAQ